MGEEKKPDTLKSSPLGDGGIKVAHVIRVFSYGGAEVLLREILSQPEFKAQVISDVFVLEGGWEAWVKKNR